MTISQRALVSLHRGKLGSAPLACPCCGEDPPPASLKAGQLYIVGCENPDCWEQPTVEAKTLAGAWGLWHHRVMA